MVPFRWTPADRTAYFFAECERLPCKREVKRHNVETDTPAPQRLDGHGQQRLLEILESSGKRGLPALQQECVILFTDIVGFSSYASRHSDTEALELVRVGLMRLKGMDDPVELFRVEQKQRPWLLHLVAAAFVNPFGAGNWRWSSWAFLAIGVLLAASMLLSKPSSEFPHPAMTAAGFLVLFCGWSLQWAAYRPRTLSFWHPLMRVNCLLLWAGVVLPAGALLGCWPG
jgi:hypothetical protein